MVRPLMSPPSSLDTMNRHMGRRYREIRAALMLWVFVGLGQGPARKTPLPRHHLSFRVHLRSPRIDPKGGRRWGGLSPSPMALEQRETGGYTGLVTVRAQLDA